MTWIDNSRILAIFAVVFLHVAVEVVVRNGVGSQYWWIGNFYDSMVRWSVPVLVMVSGALLLDPGKSEHVSEFYRKRVARILIPILFWSAFFLGLLFFKGILIGDDPTPKSVILSILSKTPYHHMWFLYMLIGLYLFTPFLRKITANSTMRELTIMTIILFILSSINSAYGKSFGHSKLFINWFLMFLPYYFMGYLIRKTNIKPRKLILFSVFFLSVTGTSLGFYLTAINNGLAKGFYFYEYLSITVIPMSISIMFLLKEFSVPIINKKITKNIALLTLGVYLVHPVFIEIVNRIGFRSELYNPILYVPMISVVVFVSSLVFAWVINKIPYLKRII